MTFQISTIILNCAQICQKVRHLGVITHISHQFLPRSNYTSCYGYFHLNSMLNTSLERKIIHKISFLSLYFLLDGTERANRESPASTFSPEKKFHKRSEIMLRFAISKSEITKREITSFNKKYCEHTTL